MNWVAAIVVAFATAFYFRLFDPMSLRVGPLFRYARAAVPTAILGAGAYYLVMRFLVAPRGTGGYRASMRRRTPSRSSCSEMSGMSPSRFRGSRRQIQSSEAESTCGFRTRRPNQTC